MEKIKNLYTHRQIARLVIEAQTPIKIGSGEKSITTDSLVMLDVNGLPYIPGTSIAGVLRHYLNDKETANNIFGYQKNDTGFGSRLIFSDAKMIGERGEVVDGLQDLDTTSSFYKLFEELPIRQHNKMNEKGVVADAGKFDQQVVYKGTRFCFEIELLAEADENTLQQLVSIFSLPHFRIGGGTRKGFGQIKIIERQLVDLDLQDAQQLQLYLAKSSSLKPVFWNQPSVESQLIDHLNEIDTKDNQWLTYSLKLSPTDFYLFGAGFGDDEVDMVPVRSSIIQWKNNLPVISKMNHWLIPGSSVKGSISHRVAYHYNKLQHIFADQIPQDEYAQNVASNNEAVKTLFGTQGTSPKDQERGHVLLSDIFIPKEESKTTSGEDRDEHIFNHVKIDSFTSGGMDGALFSEKAVYNAGKLFTMNIMVEKSQLENPKIKEAFEATLNDLCKGLLPLGGCVNKGYGCFSGKYEIQEPQNQNK